MQRYMGHGFNVKLSETFEGKCVTYKTLQLISTYASLVLN